MKKIVKVLFCVFFSFSSSAFKRGSDRAIKVSQKVCDSEGLSEWFLESKGIAPIMFYYDDRIGGTAPLPHNLKKIMDRSIDRALKEANGILVQPESLLFGVEKHRVSGCGEKESMKEICWCGENKICWNKFVIKENKEALALAGHRPVLNFWGFIPGVPKYEEQGWNSGWADKDIIMIRARVLKDIRKLLELHDSNPQVIEWYLGNIIKHEFLHQIGFAHYPGGYTLYRWDRENVMHEKAFTPRNIHKVEDHERLYLSLNNITENINMDWLEEIDSVQLDNWICFARFKKRSWDVIDKTEIIEKPDGTVIFRYEDGRKYIYRPDGIETSTEPGVEMVKKRFKENGETKIRTTLRFSFRDLIKGKDGIETGIVRWTELDIYLDGKKVWTHSDGNVEIRYKDGSKENILADGTIIRTYSDRVEIIHKNRIDIIWQHEGRREVTWEDGTRQFFNSDGTEKVIWEDGTTQVKKPDGTEVWTWPDGTRQDIRKNGAEVWTYPDGTEIRVYLDGAKTRINPDGTEIRAYPDMPIILLLPDGDVQRVPFIDIGTLPDGREVHKKPPESDWIELQITVRTVMPDETEFRIDSDGAKVRTYPDGVEMRTYSDGTEVRTYPDGAEIIIKPELKVWILPRTNQGTEINTTEVYRYTDGQEFVVNPDGTEKFIWKDGTTQVKKPDGTKEMIWPDGKRQYTQKNGTEVWTYPDGAKFMAYLDGAEIRKNLDGTEIRAYPDMPTILLLPDGDIQILPFIDIGTLPDGREVHKKPSESEKVELQITVRTVMPDETEFRIDSDGAKVWTYPDRTEKVIWEDGTIQVKKPDGTKIIEKPDGIEVRTYSDGTEVRTYPDGAEMRTYPDGAEIIIKPEVKVWILPRTNQGTEINMTGIDLLPMIDWGTQMGMTEIDLLSMIDWGTQMDMTEIDLLSMMDQWTQINMIEIRLYSDGRKLVIYPDGTMK